ncbi:hypothetical protein Pryu01_02816 [Paraliobacillus ryukyuensis]|uniref:Voltage-gated potassium channel n=1 Tax=Paraliobacillus ryukyuensis TaxID=200904 RepID=A0A366E6W4_9BACI|nr:potassium channel family protein [Paraliobacillus ryukyuensis]RBO98116.1 voltage-gated potassium channel [Paraliobacillus ryukyuensis]
MYLYKLFHFYFRLPVLIRLLLTVSILMLSFGIIIHVIEPEHFPSIFDGIWWAFVTGSTVGYGDFVPLSSLGKIIGILLILTGGGLVTFYMATVSSTTIKREEAIKRGDTVFKGKHHIIFIGWNERARQLLAMLEELNKKEHVVLIDRTLKQLPQQAGDCHFVRGDPTSDDILAKANIQEAAYAVITADPAKQESHADQTSILTTLALRGNNPKVYIITEILTKEQLSNAKRAGADTVIRSNDFMSTLFFHEIFRASAVQPFEMLLKILAKQQFSLTDVSEELAEQTFLQISNTLVSAEYLLIGIVKQHEIMINPSYDTIVTTEDKLLLLEPM